MVINVKLYLQRDTSDIHSRYQVCDESGVLRYTIIGKRNPSGECVRINDTGGDTVCKIRGLGFSALSVFSISSSGESIRLNIAVANGRAAVRFRGISFFARGDVLLGSYSILDADTSVVCSAGKDFAKGCVQLEINQDEREIFCLAVAACIDSLAVGRAPVLQMS